MNPFLEHADRAIPSSVQRRETRAQARAIAKAQAEKDKLLAMRNAEWAQLRDRTIATSPHRHVFTNFLETIDRAGPDDGEQLVAVARAARMMRLPIAQRQFLLSAISGACIRIRRELDLPWCDDPIPFGGPDEGNVFLDAKREIDL